LELYGVKVPIKLIVDAEIEDYDNFVKQIKERVLRPGIKF